MRVASRARVALRPLLAICVFAACSTPAAPPVHWPDDDRSFSSEQLVRLGFPPTEHDWGVAEYQRAAAVLQDVAAVDPRGLPRHGSARSGDVFARIVSTENLAVLRDPDVAHSTRVEIGGAQHDAIQRILLTYLEPAERHVIFDEELARMIGLYLQSSLLLWPLFEGVLELPASPEDTARRRRALDDIRESFGQIVVGACVALRDFAFRPSARRTLAGHLAVTLPELVPAMSPEARQEAGEVLRGLVQVEQDPGVRADLDATVRQL